MMDNEVEPLEITQPQVIDVASSWHEICVISQ